MFRYSLVYGVRDIHHPLCAVIKSYASVLKTTAFSPRITIRHSLSFETALSLHRLFSAEYNLPKIDFVDEVSVSCSMLFNANGKRVSFYSLEQPVLLNDQRVPGLHVSLAYKLGTPFTLSERNMVGPWHGTLLPDDLVLTVYSCHAKSPKFWRQVLQS
jgi:hypothetical protein